MQKFTFTLLLIGIINCSIIGQNAVSVQADRYNFSVLNNFPYRLNITLKSGNNSETKMLRSGYSWSEEGYYSKSKIRRKTIVCDYNQETYRLDKQDLDNQLSDTKLSLLRSKNSNDNIILSDLRNKILAELASNVRTDSDNWLLKGLTWTIRAGGNLVKGVYTFKELTETINSMNYKSYEELFEDFLADRFEKAAVDKASDLIEREIGLDSDISEYVLNATLYYLHKSDEIEENYENNIQRAEERHSKLVNEIQGYRDDSSFSRRNTYNAYDIARKPLDLRTKSPNFLITIDPLCYGNGINKYWDSAPEKIFTDEDNNDELEWSDGLWNSTIGGSFHFPLTRELNFSKKFYSRIYGGVSYYNTSYKLNSGFSLSNNFFSQVPPNSQSFSISNPIGFEHSRLGGSAIWRFYMGRTLFLDFEGGYVRQRGKLNLRESELSEGYEWAETSIEIVEETYQPYFGGRIGIGKNKFHKGTHFSVGAHFFKIDQSNQTDFNISETATDFPINFDSEDKYLFRVNVGISTSF